MREQGATLEDRLEIIIDQIEVLQRELAGVTFATFAADRSRRDLSAFRIQTIGENCHRLGEEVKSRHPDLPWSDIYGMRNIIAHHYDRINPVRIWAVVRDHLDPVRAMARAELTRCRPRDGLPPPEPTR